MAFEMARHHLRFGSQVVIPVVYEAVHLDCGYRADFIVEGSVIVELKSAARLERIDEAQVLSYMKLSGCQIGLLLNFNTLVLRDGIRRLTLRSHLTDEPEKRITSQGDRGDRGEAI